VQERRRRGDPGVQAAGAIESPGRPELVIDDAVHVAVVLAEVACRVLHSTTVGVPNVGETAAYYREFGLSPSEDGWFSTRDADRQLRIVHAP
jgi:hypothetical protein